MNKEYIHRSDFRDERRTKRESAATPKPTTKNIKFPGRQTHNPEHCKPCHGDLRRRMQATQTWRFRLFRQDSWRLCRDDIRTYDKSELPEKMKNRDCRKRQSPECPEESDTTCYRYRTSVKGAPHLHVAEDFPCLSWTTFEALPPGSTVQLDRPV